MKSILSKILIAVISLVALTGLVRAELIVEEAGLDKNFATSVSSDFGKVIITYGHWHEVKSVSGSPNGDLATGLVNGEISVWVKGTQTLKRTIAGHRALVSSTKYLPNGNLVSVAHDSYARIWNTNDSYSSRCYSYYGTGAEKFNQVLPILNSDYYVIARLNVVTVFNSNTCQHVRHLNNHTAEVLSLARLANDELVSGSADKTIKIWNWRNGTLKRTIQGHLAEVTALVQLPTGELASGSADKTIKIWNPNDQSTLIHTLSAHTGPITALVPLPNGLLASSSSSDNIIRIWDTYRGVNTHSFAGHTGGINDLALLPSGELASAGIDKSVKLWVSK